MSSWLKRQWDDIKGHVKFFILITTAPLLLSAALALTRGLQRWQQVLLALIFSSLFAWAVIASKTAAQRPRLSEQMPLQLPESKTGRLPGSKEDSLQERLFTLCRGIREFVNSQGPEPPDVYTSGMSSQEFVEANKPKFLRSAKLHHGFHLRFYEDVVRLYHECGELGVDDGELFKALHSDLTTDSDILKIGERLGQLALEIERARLIPILPAAPIEAESQPESRVTVAKAGATTVTHDNFGSYMEYPNGFPAIVISFKNRLATKPGEQNEAFRKVTANLVFEGQSGTEHIDYGNWLQQYTRYVDFNPGETHDLLVAKRNSKEGEPCGIFNQKVHDPRKQRFRPNLTIHPPLDRTLPRPPCTVTVTLLLQGLTLFSDTYLLNWDDGAMEFRHLEKAAPAQ